MCIRDSKTDLPAPTASIAAGFREMWPALRRQLAQEDYFVLRDLPPTAKPYRQDLHETALGAAHNKGDENGTMDRRLRRR